MNQVGVGADLCEVAREDGLHAAHPAGVCSTEVVQFAKVGGSVGVHAVELSLHDLLRKPVPNDVQLVLSLADGSHFAVRCVKDERILRPFNGWVNSRVQTPRPHVSAPRPRQEARTHGDRH